MSPFKRYLRFIFSLSGKFLSQRGNRPFYPARSLSKMGTVSISRRSWGFSPWILLLVLPTIFLSAESQANLNDKKDSKQPPQQRVVQNFLNDRYTFTNAEVVAIDKLSENDRQMLLVYFSLDFIKSYETHYIISALSSIQERHGQMLLSYKAKVEFNAPVIQKGDKAVTYDVKIRYLDSDRSHYSDFPELITVKCEVHTRGAKQTILNCLIDDLVIKEGDVETFVP